VQTEHPQLDVIVEEALALLKPDFELLRRGRARQTAVWEGAEPDYLPLSVVNTPVEERDDYPAYDTKEQFYDKRKMLVEKTWELIGVARGRSDGQLAASVDLGAGFIPGALGLEQMLFEDKPPWLKESLSKERISGIEPNELGDFAAKGLAPRALDYTEYFREKLDGKAHASLCGDMLWGPFTLAHLIRGDAIFIDVHDDPPFVHHLMEIATELYIRAVKLIKEAAGEPLTTGYRGQTYLAGGGVVVNEDTMTLVSPRHAEEFVFPYLKRALAPFDGGIVHFCGDGRHVLDALLGMPEVKGVNFGDPQHYSYEEVMGKLLSRGKFYQGGWPREDEETTADYFGRLLAPLGGGKRGLIAAYWIDPEQETAREVMDVWRSVQER